MTLASRTRWLLKIATRLSRTASRCSACHDCGVRFEGNGLPAGDGCVWPADRTDSSPSQDRSRPLMEPCGAASPAVVSSCSSARRMSSRAGRSHCSGTQAERHRSGRREGDS